MRQKTSKRRYLIDMTLATRLQSLMRRRGIRSQSQLARLSGVSQTSIHRILCGAHRGTHSLDVLSRLALALDASPSWLMHAELPDAPPRRPRDLQDPDEREWCELYRQLPGKEKQAVLALARSLGPSAPPTSSRAV